MKSLGFFGVMFTAATLFGATECAAYSHARVHYTNPRVAVDFDYFYDALTPYGLWVSVDPYGTCWAPDVPDGWTPYGEDGYWVQSDYGWTWVSDEPWGWAAFHYGRWAWTDDYGWIWVPGTDWAPAWVAWRYGDGVVGWAPLPPEVGWQVNIGFTIGDYDRYITPRSWCFVHDRDFLRPHIGRYVMHDRRGDEWIRTTRDVTRYSTVNGRIIDRGIDTRMIEQRTGRRIPVMRVLDHSGPRASTVRGREVRIYRPSIRGSEGRDVRQYQPPERVRQQVNENRRFLQQQREERANFQARYQTRIMSLPPSERQSISRRMTDDQRRLYETQRNARRQIMRQNTRHAVPQRNGGHGKGA